MLGLQYLQYYNILQYKQYLMHTFLMPWSGGSGELVVIFLWVLPGIHSV